MATDEDGVSYISKGDVRRAISELTLGTTRIEDTVLGRLKGEELTAAMDIADNMAQAAEDALSYLKTKRWDELGF